MSRKEEDNGVRKETDNGSRSANTQEQERNDISGQGQEGDHVSHGADTVSGSQNGRTQLQQLKTINRCILIIISLERGK